MSEEILINVTPPETRVAKVENGVVQEVIVERSRSRGIVGNIYKGRVCRVLPGMQAAFVEIGLERAAFLHASAIAPGTANHHGDTEGEPEIASVVREGQEIIVQVLKDPIGTKGARLTTQVSIPSRCMVLMPALETIGISQKIEDEEERTRLRDILTNFQASGRESAGFIARTAAESMPAETLYSDMEYLTRVWNTIQEKSVEINAGQIIHEDLGLALRALRDMVGPDIDRILYDSRETYSRALDFAHRLIPGLEARLELYDGEHPLFDLYSIEDEIQKSLESSVQLKSGGHLVIDQTEAMTTVDVNTGAYVGSRNLEETIFKTNLEAAQAIARQLRLRNLGGIIIIDFIDMHNEEHKRQVLRALDKALARDHTRTNITEVSQLGLVEMTRKRTRESLEHVLCEACPVCEGRGSLKTAETTCYEIFREILRESRQYDAESLLVLASQSVVDRLLDEEASYLAELEEFIQCSIRLQVEALYSQQQYDVVLL